jgi:hypothetical protein
MRKLFIAFVLLSMISAPAFAGVRDGANATASHAGSVNSAGSAGHTGSISTAGSTGSAGSAGGVASPGSAVGGR